MSIEILITTEVQKKILEDYVILYDYFFEQTIDARATNGNDKLEVIQGNLHGLTVIYDFLKLESSQLQEELEDYAYSIASRTYSTSLSVSERIELIHLVWNNKLSVYGD